MLINIQTTADENIRNFCPEKRIFKNNVAEFADTKSLRKSPLAEAIFDLGGVESVLISQDMVSVTNIPSASWEDLSPQIMAEILDFAATGAQAVLESETIPEETPEALMKKISGLVAARIRPALNRDGGDIELNKFEDGVLWVKLTGKCAGCPYAMRTLKDGVEKILKNYIPQITEVKPVGQEE